MSRPRRLVSSDQATLLPKFVRFDNRTPADVAGPAFDQAGLTLDILDGLCGFVGVSVSRLLEGLGSRAIVPSLIPLLAARAELDPAREGSSAT